MPEEKPWWETSKWGPYVLSKCCQWPICSPHQYPGESAAQCKWHCSKPRCDRRTDHHGLLLDEDAPLSGYDVASHGLSRKDAMAGNAYQPGD